MATEYTKTDKSIHLLNDRNIAQKLSGDDVPKFNAIPSLDLFSAEINGVKDEVSAKIGELSCDDEIEASKFVTSVKQADGKISVTREQPEISDVSGLNDRLTEIESGYLKKDRDENVKSLSVENGLAVGGSLNTTNIKTGDELVKIEGSAGADGKKHGTLEIDFEGGLESVKVNGTSLQKTLDDTISSLKSDEVRTATGEIISVVSQKDGVVVSGTRKLTHEDIPVLPQDKVENLSDDFLKRAEFKATLTENSEEFLTDDNIKFEELTRREDGKHVIRLTNTKTGKNKDIDCSSFVKDGMVKTVKTNYVGDAEHPNAPYLVITWNDDAGGDVSWIPVKDLLNDIYKVKDGDNGIEIKNYEVSLNYDVVTKHEVFDPVKDYVDALRGTSSAEPGIIHELSGDVKSALQNDIRQMKFDGRIVHVATGDSIRDILKKNHDIASENQVRNNSFYLIKMEDEGYKDPTSEFETSDGFVLRNGDLVVIHDADASRSSIPLDTLLNENIHIFKMGVDFKEFNDEVNAREAGDTQISSWLEGQFNTDNLNKDIAELEIKKDIRTEHSLGIDASKLKYSDGYTAEDVTLSVEDLCAYIDGLDGEFETGNRKKISKITQTNGKIDVEYSDLISSDVIGIDDFVVSKIGELSCDDSESENEFVTSVRQVNGKIEVTRKQPEISNVIDLEDSLENLSTEIDRKISIGTVKGSDVDVRESDLSVVKINYADYRNLVIEGKTSESCIYIISDDYDDAMGHQLCNLAMPDDADGKYTGVAATKPYVDEKITEVATGAKTAMNAKLNGILTSVQNSLSGFTDTEVASSTSLESVFDALNMMYNVLGELNKTLK